MQAQLRVQLESSVATIKKYAQGWGSVYSRTSDTESEGVQRRHADVCNPVEVC